VSAPRRRLGLRGEVLVLLAGALLLLLLVSTFTLFAYRGALHALAEDRRADAARLAGALAEALPTGRLASVEELRRMAPGVRRVAIVDAGGGTLVDSGGLAGEAPDGSLLAPLGAERARSLERPVGVGPDEALPGSVAGFAPLGPAGGRRLLRVDLAAGALAPQLRGMRVLSALVLTVNGALAVLLVLFLRHLVTPFDLLVERARQLGGGEASGEDEVALLRRTLERAFANLSAAAAEPAEGGGEDDIAALRRTLATSLESGVLLLDRAGAVVALNPVGAELLGVAPPAAGTVRPLGETFSGFPELAALLADAVAGSHGVRRHELAVDAPAGRRTLGITVHLLRRDDGGVRGHLVLFADLTESQRQAREEQLAESLAGLGELAAGVAHELRNSLATLRGYLTLIERSPDEESIADYLGEIRRETDHLQRVLEDFLAFARPETARPEPVDLAALARRAAADPALGEIELRIRDDSDGRARLDGDPQLLERAIRNLLHNAVEAEREAGRSGPVEITLGAGREGAELTVEDRGPGVPPAVRERLFHPFATGRAGGVGLGLALAHRIVTLHGGSLRLEDRDGGGTRAVVAFAAGTPRALPAAEG
jgi:signal transduction histidine kinase